MINLNAIKSQSFIKFGVAGVFTLMLTGCGGNHPLILWWDLDSYKGYFPLMSDKGQIYINGNRVFIKSTSILVNCEGSPLKIGKRTLFLERKLTDSGLSTIPSVLAYNTETKNVDTSYSFPTVAEINGLPAQVTENLHIDIALAGNVAASKPQCNETDEYWKSYTSFSI